MFSHLSTNSKKKGNYSNLYKKCHQTDNIYLFSFSTPFLALPRHPEDKHVKNRAEVHLYGVKLTSSCRIEDSLS